jgi:hypothetical protein
MTPAKRLANHMQAFALLPALPKLGALGSAHLGPAVFSSHRHRSTSFLKVRVASTE